MGLFVDKAADLEGLEEELAEAYAAPQKQPDEAHKAARAKAPRVAKKAAPKKNEYKLGRIVFAVGFFLVLLGIAIAAEALDWVDDPGKIYDFAGLVLAVIIGYIGGESAA